jgi:putative transposase
MARKKGFKYRFYPTEEQEAVLAKVFGHTRYVWNWALELRTNAYYEEGESLSYTDTSKGWVPNFLYHQAD